MSLSADGESESGIGFQLSAIGGDFQLAGSTSERTALIHPLPKNLQSPDLDEWREPHHSVRIAVESWHTLCRVEGQFIEHPRSVRCFQAIQLFHVKTKLYEMEHSNAILEEAGSLPAPEKEAARLDPTRS